MTDTLSEILQNSQQGELCRHRRFRHPSLLQAMCTSMPELEDVALTAMGAAPADDPYLMPTLMVSLVLHDCGYDETNLGPSIPLDVLCDLAEDEQTNLVWVAVTNPIRSRTHHREMENLAAAVMAYRGRFLIGGSGASSYEGLSAVRCHAMSDLERYAQSPAAEHLRPTK